MDLLSKIRHNVERGQIATIANLDVIPLQVADWQTQLHNIYKNGIGHRIKVFVYFNSILQYHWIYFYYIIVVVGSNRPTSTSTFVFYLQDLLPNMDPNTAVNDYWQPLLYPILMYPDGSLLPPSVLNDVITCCAYMLSRRRDLVKSIMDEYMRDRHRALESRHIPYSGTTDAGGNGSGENRTLVETDNKHREALPNPYWETRTSHVLERLLISWVKKCTTPQVSTGFVE